MILFFAKHPLIRKLLVTWGIVILFITGRYIPLPNVVLGDYVNLNPFLDTAVSLTGGSLSKIGLFSLGLGPMMYGMLLMQLFTLGKRQQKTPPKVMEFRRHLLVLIVGVIQGMSLAVNLRYISSNAFLAQVLQVTVVLVAGAFVLTYLSNLNTAFGLGGPSVIVLTSILFSHLETLPVIKKLWQEGRTWLVIGFTLWLLLTVFLIVLFERAEYRIPIQRISIHNKHANSSYLPIKVNVAGGMPLMYAHSVLGFPQYVVLLLEYFFPKWEGAADLARYFSLMALPGVLIYLVVIFILTLLLAFVNVDVVNLTDGMRQSGDYIPFIRPGKPTQRYISQYVRLLSIFNAFYLIILAGLPLLVTLGDTDAQLLAGLTGVAMMAAGILLTIFEELKVLRLKKQYVSLFD